MSDKKEIIKEEYSEQENASGRTADTNIVTEISKAKPEASTAGSWWIPTKHRQGRYARNLCARWRKRYSAIWKTV